VAREVADAAALEALGREAQASLDLARGPLLRAVLAEYQGEQRLLLVIHHLAVDGVSWRILFEDLQQAYEQGAQAQLPARTSSVRDWAGQLQDYARGDAAQQQWITGKRNCRCRHRPAVRAPRRQPGQPARPFGGHPAVAGTTRKLLQEPRRRTAPRSTTCCCAPWPGSSGAGAGVTTR
jgi:hypothetical protein